MAIRLEYDASNNIFFLTSMMINSRKEGIALDALRVVFQNLKESTERLETKLLDISEERNGLDDRAVETQLVYSSVMGDVWFIIDGIRRLELLLKHISPPPVEIAEELNTIFKNIKGIRDSFQHIDERIELHFDRFGGSVFGDIYWRYQQKPTVPDVLHCLISGVSRVSRDMVIDAYTKVRDSFVPGIYDLEIRYIKRDSRKGDDHTVVKINIDSAVTTINKLIDYLEVQYSEFLVKSDLAEKVPGDDDGLYQNKEMVCDPPRIFRFKAGVQQKVYLK